MSLRADLERVGRMRPLLVGVDFDGTIAHIADHPSAARPDESAHGALHRLVATPGVHVAVVSGRRREELASLLGDPPGMAIIGEHGSDTGSTGSEPPDVDDLVRDLEQIAADVPGSRVERKRWSVVFHYRQADPDHGPHAVQRVLEGPGAQAGVVVRKGNMVVELHATETSKGDAVEELRASVGAACVIFFGDDVTDEDVFSTLGEGDLGVKVGAGPSQARHRVRSVEEVASALHHLADLAEDGSPAG